jgi:hypothetical protein
MHNTRIAIDIIMIMQQLGLGKAQFECYLSKEKKKRMEKRKSSGPTPAKSSATGSR